MRNILHVACLTAVGMMFVPSESASAAFVVGWDAIDSGMDQAVSPIPGPGSNVSMFSVMTRGPGINYQPDTVNPVGRDYVSSDWTTSTSPSATDYIQFVLTTSDPFTAYDLDEFRLYGMRTADGPDDFRLQADTGSGFANIGAVVSLGGTGVVDMMFDLTPLPLVTSVTFRLFGYNSLAESSTALFNIPDDPDYDELGGGESDVAIFGTIAAIPEPSAFLFGGLVCGVFGAAAVKRRLSKRRQAAPFAA
jgi:hypothetical protein